MESSHLGLQPIQFRRVTAPILASHPCVDLFRQREHCPIAVTLEPPNRKPELLLPALHGANSLAHVMSDSFHDVKTVCILRTPFVGTFRLDRPRLLQGYFQIAK